MFGSSFCSAFPCCLLSRSFFRGLSPPLQSRSPFFGFFLTSSDALATSLLGILRRAANTLCLTNSTPRKRPFWYRKANTNTCSFWNPNFHNILQTFDYIKGRFRFRPIVRSLLDVWGACSLMRWADALFIEHIFLKAYTRLYK